MRPSEAVLLLRCADRCGIVASVAGYLFEQGCNILDSQQFRDPDTGMFFMRVHLGSENGASVETLRAGFAALAQRFGMDWGLYDSAVKPRILILVSRAGHCLNDLLFRWQSGALPVDVAAVVSNHPDLAAMAASYGLPFHHRPVDAHSRQAQEQGLLELIDHERIELIVLARYMQILSPALTRALEGRAINIHHSFLPSFKGARPYAQAYARGVKIIGATAHYVTTELDEGPIICQDIAHVEHRMNADELQAIGRDIESRVLARAVKAHVEHRVALNGIKTVVFQ